MMAMNKKTCADCQHGEFFPMRRLTTPRKELQGEKICIHCMLFNFYGRTDRPMCRHGIPENRGEYFKSLGLTMMAGFLIPDNLDKAAAVRAILQAKKKEQNDQRNLIKKKKQKEINKESVVSQKL